MGFKHPPAHHYYRAAYWAITKERGLRNRLVGKADNYACQQELPAYTHQLRVLGDVLTSQPGPVFAYLHLSELTHNELAMAGQYDRPVHSLLTSLAAQGALNDTFFLLMADHGFQRGDNPFTLTPQGKVENNMPALVVVPPASLEQERPDMLAALRANAEGLTSHLDLYATLRELLALGSPAPLEERNLTGSSLLHPLPPRRCAEAGVPPEHCCCTEGLHRLEPASMEVVATAVLADTDTFLAPLGLCRGLALQAVTEATLREEEEELVLELQIRVRPKAAVFQVTLALSPAPHHLQAVTLTRMDWYSSTSSCLPPSSPHLRPYCIC